MATQMPRLEAVKPVSLVQVLIRLVLHVQILEIVALESVELIILILMELVAKARFKFIVI